MKIHLAARGRKNVQIQLLDVRFTWASADPSSVRLELTGTHMQQEERKSQKIFVSVMKWQSPGFIRAKCSYSSTVVHSLCFWKAFIVLVNVHGFCAGTRCSLRMCGPFAPSSGRTLNCSRKHGAFSLPLRWNVFATQNPDFFCSQAAEMFLERNLPASSIK